jgi:hypothetical protein
MAWQGLAGWLGGDFQRLSSGDQARFYRSFINAVIALIFDYLGIDFFVEIYKLWTKRLHFFGRHFDDSRVFRFGSCFL